MHRLITILFFFLLLVSCGTSKRIIPQKEMLAVSEQKENDLKPLEASKTALDFLGTPYKYGGTTKTGMDCSGLIFTAFLEANVPLPRTAREMSLLGHRINLENVATGDLLFFETSKKRKVINHVGLVVEVKPEELLFIHSTTSRGVIISSLNENYWRENFIMARRVE